MRPLAPVIAFGLLSGCWYEKPRPARPTHPEPNVEAPASRYRSTTIAVDALGVAAMTAGMIGLQGGHDEDLSGGLLVVGLATAAYVTPLVHLAHGDRGRAGGSLLVRSIAVTTGTGIGIAAGCSEPRVELFCGLTGMLWGITGGLAIGGAIDAIFFHDKRSSRTWSPTATTSEGGARVGILGAF